MFPSPYGGISASQLLRLVRVQALWEGMMAESTEEGLNLTVCSQIM